MFRRINVSGAITNKVKRFIKWKRNYLQIASYKLKGIHSARFIPRLLSNLVNNFTEGVQKLNVNIDIIIKHVKHVELNTKTERAVSNTPTLEMM